MWSRDVCSALCIAHSAVSASCGRQPGCFQRPTLAIRMSDCSSGIGPLSPANGSLLAQFYNNTAFTPGMTASSAFTTSSYYAYAPSLAFSFPSSLPAEMQPSAAAAPTPFSFAVWGYVVVPNDGLWSFTCRGNASQLQVMLWADDHVLCPKDDEDNLQLPLSAGQLLHLRLEVVQQTPYSPQQALPHLEVMWSQDFGLYTPIAPSLLRACLTPPRVAQVDWHTAQLITSGWDTLYNTDALTMTLLPQSLGVTFGLYQLSTQSFRTGFNTEQWPGDLLFRVTAAGSASSARPISRCSSCGRT